ncbi:MAG: arginine-tRNA-protein transferase [Chitinophagaceae bacterium]|nr:arginine-tRNA-protein transferase [Chitinophagaceae bacterium]
MEFPAYHNSKKLNSTQLDTFLSQGWYRMHQSVFTTKYIILNDSTYNVFWLRYNLPGFNINKKLQKLIIQNRHFHISIKPMVITTELETLYKIYRSSIKFDHAESVKYWLYGEEAEKENAFETNIIEIRDGSKLIAAGIFDNGYNSIAGIMNFYDPAYKKFSLGKYLILLKIKYAIEKGMHWYYPGYIVYGYPSFDYKLFVGEENIEIYIPEINSWYKYKKQLLETIEVSRQHNEL